MENLKLLFLLYIRPSFTMSEIMDKANWFLAALFVFIVSIAFYFTINSRLNAAYAIPQFDFGAYSQLTSPSMDEEGYELQLQTAQKAYQQALAEHKGVPVVGDRLLSFFTFEPTKFYLPIIALAIFYVPISLFIASFFSNSGSFGAVLSRDYGTLATCSYMAWTAAHLPFAIAGILLYQQTLSPEIYLAFWIASGLFFGLLMIFALRTVMGIDYAKALVMVCLSWIGFTVAMYVLSFASPLLFSPFILFYAYLYFGGRISGEATGFSNNFRQRQNFKRFLQNATINPNDSDAHVQLGLIYKQRRQDTKATEHFEKALAIDKTEIDANYEMGKIAREQGNFQKAIDHFSVVVEQNDKHSLSEIWREIGATYLAANMLDEAKSSLETFTERRPFDPEGLYYYGKALKAMGKAGEARDAFHKAVESAKSSPDYRKHAHRQWSKLAQKEIA